VSVCAFVSLYVRWTHKSAGQKWLQESGCNLHGYSDGPKYQVLDMDHNHPGEGAILEAYLGMPEDHIGPTQQGNFAYHLSLSLL